MPAALLFPVLLGIFVFVVTPVLAVYALVKHTRLRHDFETLREENRKQASEHGRQISEIAQLSGSRKPSKSSLSSTGKIRRKPGLSGWNMKFTTANL